MHISLESYLLSFITFLFWGKWTQVFFSGPWTFLSLFTLPINQKLLWQTVGSQEVVRKRQNEKSWTSVSVCCGVSVSVELSLIEVITEAMEVGVSSSSVADGLSSVTSLASWDSDSGGGGPSELCSWITQTEVSKALWLHSITAESFVYIMHIMFTLYNTMSLRLSSNDKTAAVDAGSWAESLVRAQLISAPLPYNLYNLSSWIHAEKQQYIHTYF